MCSKRQKRHNVKGLNIITNKNGAKTMRKNICKFSSKTSNSNPNEILKQINMNVKIIVHPSTCICENSKIQKLSQIL